MKGNEMDLEDKIGKALHEVLTKELREGAPTPDWNDSREVDRLVDVVMKQLKDMAHLYNQGGQPDNVNYNAQAIAAIEKLEKQLDCAQTVVNNLPKWMHKLEERRQEDYEAEQKRKELQREPQLGEPILLMQDYKSGEFSCTDKHDQSYPDETPHPDIHTRVAEDLLASVQQPIEEVSGYVWFKDLKQPKTHKQLSQEKEQVDAMIIAIDRDELRISRQISDFPSLNGGLIGVQRLEGACDKQTLAALRTMLVLRSGSLSRQINEALEASLKKKYAPVFEQLGVAWSSPHKKRVEQPEESDGLAKQFLLEKLHYKFDQLRALNPPPRSYEVARQLTAIEDDIRKLRGKPTPQC